VPSRQLADRHRRVRAGLHDQLTRPGVTYSFEFFPPKTDAGEQALWQALRELEPIGPGFVSVTYGAGGSTRDRTVRVTRRIAEETTLTPMAHLTCVGSSRAEVAAVLGQYADAGIHNVLALRGDPPGGPQAAFEPHPDGLEYASELVELVRSLGSFEVGVAAFPEGHPEARDLDHDADVLVAKADAGATFAITQFFFHTDDYLRLVDRVRSRGCDLPIVPGIMPVTNVSQIERFAALSGAVFPPALARRLHAVADDPAAVRSIGVEVATEMASRLIEEGVPGLHFYTLNRSTATREVHAALS
jgi:methylenetetrahydrofolate reductase (NADPH)